MNANQKWLVMVQEKIIPIFTVNTDSYAEVKKRVTNAQNSKHMFRVWLAGSFLIAILMTLGKPIATYGILLGAGLVIVGLCGVIILGFWRLQSQTNSVVLDTETLRRNLGQYSWLHWAKVCGGPNHLDPMKEEVRKILEGLAYNHYMYFTVQPASGMGCTAQNTFGEALAIFRKVELIDENVTAETYTLPALEKYAKEKAGEMAPKNLQELSVEMFGKGNPTSEKKPAS